MPEIREFNLPDLGEGLEDAEIVQWFVAVGDEVALNQDLVEVESAKAVVAIPSPFAGVIRERNGEPGDVMAVGQVLCRIDLTAVTDALSDRQDEDDPKPLVGYGTAATTEGGRRPRGVAPATETSTGPGEQATGTVLAKPPVRKLAKDLGVDLAALMPGTGPDGTITRADVETFVDRSSTPVTQSAAVADAAGRKRVPGFGGRRPGEVEHVHGIRKRIIARMEASRQTIPEAVSHRQIDVTELWRARQEFSASAAAEGLTARITPFVIVCRATILALRRFPVLNARYDSEAGEIRLLERINLGIAVDTERGLMVPNIKDAHAKSTLELAIEAAELAARCRDGSIEPKDLTGGTFTANNYGYFGVDQGDPIINAPEAGILGIGAMRDRPWVHDGDLAVRKVCMLTLAFDHRVCDGGDAGRFISYVGDLCEDPTRILLHV